MRLLRKVSGIFIAMAFLVVISGNSFYSTDPVPKEKDRSYNFSPIDSIVQAAIQIRAFPGCQVLVMHEGQKVFQKSYGYLTYDSLVEVNDSTIYDLASVTKVAATTLMVMDLYDKGQIDLDASISCYLPEYVETNKEDITIKQLMAHNAGLRPGIPFWQTILKDDMLEPIVTKAPTNQYGEVYHPVLEDSVRSWIRNSRLLRYRNQPYYRYSDLGFMILQMIAERIACEDMESYMMRQYYQPLKLERTVFNPLKKGVPYTQIAPTEYDIRFRFDQVWGNVHDRNAAILGGVSGHAGLFSTAEELGTLTQMILNRGEADSLRFFHPYTFETFNTKYFNRNRRALGFDKKNEKVSQLVSTESFGHKGFTGTMIWADPDHDLVYVFLSNRVYPDADNRKLITHQVRSKIQDVIYRDILDYN